MRIGIVTQPLLNNYGGALQNYALQTVLKKMGYEPVTLDYVPHKSVMRVMMSLVLNIFLFFTPRRRSFKECLPIRRDKKIEFFLEKYVNKTKVIQDYYPLLIKDYKLDGIIVGSDQVWRPLYNSDVLYHMFLDFTSGYNLKRIAYAASFGVSCNEYSEIEKKECTKLVEQFDGISVRETSGIFLCKELFNVDVQRVLDPTLLLSQDDYKSITNNIIPGGFVLSYILNPTDEIISLIKIVSNELSLRNVGIHISEKLKASVEEWLEYFQKADFIITDSFHGTVFSIVFHKRFLVLDNKGRGSSRLLSLLELFGLENLLVTDLTQPLSMLMEKNNKIDWDLVEKKLEFERCKSVGFLRNFLV